MNKLTFTKDWKNPTDFATYEGDESKVRADIQLLHDETKVALNTLIDALADTTDGSSGADEIGATPLKAGGATTVQGVMEEVKADLTASLDAHKASTDHSAAKITNTPSGNIAATNVQAAITELDTEKLAATEVVSSAQANKVLRLDANSKLPTSVTGDADATVSKLNTHKTSDDHDSRYYTEFEINGKVTTLEMADSSLLSNITTHKSSADHDGRYYTETEIDNKVAIINSDHYSKTEMQTSGQALLHWNNLTNVPPLANNNWKSPVATASALPLTGNTDGDLRLVLDTDIVYTWDAGTSKWKYIGASGSGISDHSTLTNLTADDHPQYLRSDGTRLLTGNQDFNKYQALNLVTHKSFTEPMSPAVGQLWYDTAAERLKVYKGAVQGWTDLSSKGAVLREKEIVTTAGQTVLTTTGVGTYTMGDNSMTVYRKGITGNYEQVDRSYYTESGNDAVTLTYPARAGDEFKLQWFEATADIINIMVVKDGTLQTNLNADLLDGQHGSYYAIKPTMVSQTASYTLALTDADTIQKCNSANAITVTIPLNSAVAFPIGTEIVFLRYGTGTVNFSPTTNVTLNSSDSKRYISKQYEAVTIKQIATDEWIALGSLSA